MFTISQILFPLLDIFLLTAAGYNSSLQPHFRPCDVDNLRHLILYHIFSIAVKTSYKGYLWYGACRVFILRSLCCSEIQLPVSIRFARSSFRWTTSYIRHPFVKSALFFLQFLSILNLTFQFILRLFLSVN